MMITINSPEYIKHTALLKWVQQMADLLEPARVHWCDGSKEEYDQLGAQMVQTGT